MTATPLITIKDIAEIFGVHERTVSRWKAAGKLPKPIRVQNSVRWKRKEIEIWIDSQRETSK